MNRAQRIAEQLGMPHGTATNKLRKQVMFYYIKKYGENFCYRCGSEIEVVDDLTIEHIVPWEGRDTELFWDLENISFSHRTCNVPHNRNGPVGIPPKIKKAREGEFWCWICQKSLPEDSFTKNRATWNGLESRCKECRKKTRQ